MCGQPLSPFSSQLNAFAWCFPHSKEPLIGGTDSSYSSFVNQFKTTIQMWMLQLWWRKGNSGVVICRPLLSQISFQVLAAWYQARRTCSINLIYVRVSKQMMGNFTAIACLLYAQHTVCEYVRESERTVWKANLFVLGLLSTRVVAFILRLIQRNLQSSSFMGSRATNDPLAIVSLSLNKELMSWLRQNEILSKWLQQKIVMNSA